MQLSDFLFNRGGHLSEWGLYGMGSLTFPFEQTGDDYLKSAERDLQHEDNAGNINALTNAKRAIDCQLEALISKFGLPKKKTFPERTTQLQRIGLVAPRILQKVNKTRNFLEHEFMVPERSAAEDAVDIATLFVKVTNSIFYDFYTQAEFHEPGIFSPQPSGAILRLDWKEDISGFVAHFGDVASQLHTEVVDTSSERHVDLIHLFVGLRTTQGDPVELFRTIVLKAKSSNGSATILTKA